MRLSKKILIPSMLGLFILAGSCMFFSLKAIEDQGTREIKSLRDTMIAEKTEKIKNIIELAYHTLLSVHDNPEIENDKKQIEALTQIKSLRYNKNDYLWINDMQPTMVMHPFKPDLDGKDISNVKDPNGKRLFSNMVKTCRDHGEGIVDYFWPKPGQEKPVPKLSYVKLFKPWGWVIGTGLYIDDIDGAIAEKEKTIQIAITKQRNKLILISVFILGLTTATLIWTIQSLVKPIKKAVVFAESMAQGDLTQKLEVSQKDEVGILANALNHMSANLNRMFVDVATGVNTITSSSTELSVVSEQMSQSAEQSSSRSTSVAVASEQMSSNMNSVAAACEQASTNISMVASAAEEMTATVKEIAQKSANASIITTEAVTQAKNASDKVNELGTATSKISKVTEVITDISEQTNLLALNATIEAARAGEAGKGFSVVANEIKDLANQTAAATQEIKIQIEGVQHSTTLTVDEIEQVSKIINNVNEFVVTIAAAVEEQSVTTQEIAENVNQASGGITEVNENVAQSSSVSAKIAKDIVDVNQAGIEVSSGSQQINVSAQELSHLAEQLKGMVDRFRI